MCRQCFVLFCFFPQKRCSPTPLDFEALVYIRFKWYQSNESTFEGMKEANNVDMAMGAGLELQREPILIKILTLCESKLIFLKANGKHTY